MLKAYDGSISKALFSLFPDIGLDIREFPTGKIYFQINILYLLILIIIAENQWDDATKRKKFLEKFAKNKNFDPLDPVPWYPVSHNDILKEKVYSFYF